VPSTYVTVSSAPAGGNGTVPTYKAPSTPAQSGSAGSGASASKTTAAVATFTGAANKAFAASGAGLAAVFGIAAYVL
jgi:hypothetical protein